MKDKLSVDASEKALRELATKLHLTSPSDIAYGWRSCFEWMAKCVSQDGEDEKPKQLCKDCRMFDDKWIAGFCHICQCQPEMTTEEILNKHFTNG